MCGPAVHSHRPLPMDRLVPIYKVPGPSGVGPRRGTGLVRTWCRVWRPWHRRQGASAPCAHTRAGVRPGYRPKPRAAWRALRHQEGHGSEVGLLGASSRPAGCSALTHCTLTAPWGAPLRPLITDEEPGEWSANRPSQGRVACGGEARLPSPGPLVAEPLLFTPGLGPQGEGGGSEGSGHGSFELHRLWPCPDDLGRVLKALGQEMLSGGFYEDGRETRRGE